jgi:hypothetical protein
MYATTRVSGAATEIDVSWAEVLRDARARIAAVARICPLTHSFESG